LSCWVSAAPSGLAQTLLASLLLLKALLLLSAML
jgi:hypothetical protein